MRDEKTNPPEEPEVHASDSVIRRILPKLVLSMGLGALFAWLVQRGGVPLIPSAESFARVAPWAVPVYVLMLVLTHFFRASRWRFLIAPVKPGIPFWDGVLLNWIGFFAIFALPLRLGEMARPALTKVRHQVSVSAGLGTVAVERVLDGLVTSLCVVWALVALPQLPATDEITRNLPYYGYLAVTVFSGGLVALALFLWKRELARQLVQWTIGRILPKLGRLLSEKIASMADGLACMSDARLATLFTFETLVYWGLNAAGMWVLGLGCGLEMTFGHAIAVMGILAIGILLPAGPGLFGNFQLSISTALRLYFPVLIVGEQGAVYIFLMYACQATVITLTGIVPLYAMKFSLRDLLPRRLS